MKVGGRVECVSRRKRGGAQNGNKAGEGCRGDRQVGFCGDGDVGGSYSNVGWKNRPA